MEQAVNAFVEYLHNIKKVSGNTEVSYRRDLKKLCVFMQSRGIVAVEQIGEEDLGAFMNDLEEKQFKAATMSRYVASVKAFFSIFTQRAVGA